MICWVLRCESGLRPPLQAYLEGGCRRCGRWGMLPGVSMRVFSILIGSSMYHQKEALMQKCSGAIMTIHS